MGTKVMGVFSIYLLQSWTSDVFGRFFDEIFRDIFGQIFVQIFGEVFGELKALQNFSFFSN